MNVSIFGNRYFVLPHISLFLPFWKKKIIIIIQKREEKENTLSISYIVLALR